MIIGIDATKAASKQRTGVENFVYQFISSLNNIKNHTFHLYTNEPLPTELKKSSNIVEILLPRRKFWNKIRLPLLLLKDRPQAYIQPAYMIPSFAPKNSVAIVHDFAWHKFPEAYSSQQLISQKITMKNLIRKAAKLICVSNSAKNDLMELFPNVKQEVKVVHLSGNESFKILENPNDFLNLESKFFLAVGRLESRKNIVNVVKAFFLAKEQGMEHKLVLAGKPGVGFDEIKTEIDKNNRFKDDVIIPGYIEEKDLNDLFSGAEALLYPSLYEGFGITALDAMRAGTPVITSNVSSLPEVVSDAAILVDPLDIDQIKDAMVKISNDSNFRNELIQKGIIQSDKFSWQKTANLIIKILEQK